MITKTQENRLRRVARRQGYVLQKSLQRDSRGLTFGRYRLYQRLPDGEAGSLIRQQWLTADEVAEHLREPL